MVEAVRVNTPPVEDIIDQRGLDLPAERTMLKLWRKGHDLEVELRGEEVVDRWLEKKLAAVELTRQELEEYALSLGEHLTHIQNEGWATWVAGFEERAAGLFLAVGATIQQLNRIHIVRQRVEKGETAKLPLTAFDFVNALGIRSYDEVIVDHDDWMDELASQSPEIVEQSPLLQFFREDFHSLAREAHPSLRNKIVGQAAVDAAVEGREAPAKTKGMNPHGNPEPERLERSQLINRIEKADSRLPSISACDDLAVETVNVSAAAVLLTQDFEPTDDEILLIERTLTELTDELEAQGCISDESVEGMKDDIGTLLQGMRSDVLTFVEQSDNNIQRRVFPLL